MADVTWISPLRFASAGDEKVARVFDAPGGYVESLASLGVVSGDVTADSVNQAFLLEYQLIPSPAAPRARRCLRLVFQIEL